MAAAQKALAGVVLAAGASRRMGSPKLLLPWQGGTVLGHTLDNALAGGISPLTVVCGASLEAVSAEAEARGIPWLFNKDHTLGQSTSLICGLTSVPPGSGVMFILGDMPAVQPQSYAALAAAYAESRALLIVPVNGAGRRGNPTVWPPELFAGIRLLGGDIGARGLMTKYLQQTLFLPLEDPGLYTDIDTQEDYERLLMDR